MNHNGAEWAYLSRFDSLIVLGMDGYPTEVEPISRPEDRTLRSACDLRPVEKKVWDPCSKDSGWYEKLSGDDPFALPSGKTVVPPKGGFYGLWRKRSEYFVRSTPQQEYA